MMYIMTSFYFSYNLFSYLILHCRTTLTAMTHYSVRRNVHQLAPVRPCPTACPVVTTACTWTPRPALTTPASTAPPLAHLSFPTRFSPRMLPTHTVVLILVLPSCEFILCLVCKL